MSAIHPWLRRTEPCATCPYRRETRLSLWDKAEFDRLRQHDADPLRGSIFGCHGDGHLRKVDRMDVGPCIGWVLDQKRRGIPSIQLRLELSADRVAALAFEAMSGEGLDLYASIEEMCLANFPT